MGRHSETPHIVEKWAEYKLLHRADPEKYPLAVRRIAKHADRSPTLYYSKTDDAIVELMAERKRMEDDAKAPAAAPPPPAPGLPPTLDDLRAAAAAASESPAELDAPGLDDRIRRYLDDADFAMRQFQSLVKHLDDAVVDAPAALAELEGTILRLHAVATKLKTHVAARRARTRAALGVT